MAMAQGPKRNADGAPIGRRALLGMLGVGAAGLAAAPYLQRGWEGVLGSIFAGVRWLSVGAWGRAVADEVSPQLDDVATTGLTYAVVAAVLVTAGAVWFTGDRLRSFTLRGDE